MKKLLAYFGYHKSYSWAFWVTHKKENILVIVSRQSIRVVDSKGKKDIPISEAMMFDKDTIDVKDIIFDGWGETLISNKDLKHWWRFDGIKYYK